ncbi:MAG: hypothetical protein JST00_19445 [Deltaproteobacteria bacterium]|nr:hypothetical protein [Deltaproteobacteria bacterium]
MERRGQTVAIALLAVSAVTACSLVTSFDGYGGADKNCPQRRALPERPPPSSSKASNAYVGAMKSVTFARSKKNANLPGGVEYSAVPGYDIDGRCTVDDDPSTAACRPRGKLSSDQAGTGADNGIGALLGPLLTSGLLAQQDGDAGADDVDIDIITPGIASGAHGLVVRVDKYNGQSDDDEVTVELFNVVGVNGKTDGTGRAAFDGSDTFVVDASGVTTGTTVSSTKDDRAYVRNGVLTASFGNEFGLRLTGPRKTPDGRRGVATVEVPLSRAVLVGPIKARPNGLEMVDATITGRLLVSRLFEEILKYGICPSLPSFPAVRQPLCDAADIPSSPTRSKNLVCDAVSFAFQVTLAPAKLGTTEPRPPATTLCPGAAVPTCD